MERKKKSVIIRVTKVAPKRYLIEQRRRFLWLWEFWQKGCPTLGLKKFYANKQVVKTAVNAHAEKKNRRLVLIFRTT